jgi:hypothetical protein
MLDVPTDKLTFLEAYTPNQGPKNDYFDTKLYYPAGSSFKKNTLILKSTIPQKSA